MHYDFSFLRAQLLSQNQVQSIYECRGQDIQFLNNKFHIANDTAHDDRLDRRKYTFDYLSQMPYESHDTRAVDRIYVNEILIICFAAF